MTKNKKPKKSKDPYTGEITPESEDADEIIEIMPVDDGDRSGENYLLNEETSMGKQTADDDAVPDQSGSFTSDEEIKNVFDERQGLASGGREYLEEELDEYHALSPEISGGDIDASWQEANSAGEEAVGGTVPTPDQDIVEDLGKAVGINYDPDEPLGTEEKLLKRDRDRYELNPDEENETNDRKKQD